MHVTKSVLLFCLPGMEPKSYDMFAVCLAYQIDTRASCDNYKKESVNDKNKAATEYYSNIRDKHICQNLMNLRCFDQSDAATS